MILEPRPARTPKCSVSNENLIENQWKSSSGEPGPQNGRFQIRISLKINENQALASQGPKMVAF